MVIGKNSSHSWQDVLSGTQQRIKHLFYTGCFSDIVIECPGGVSFELHRMVLAMCSPVFEAMMFGPLATSKDCLCLEDDPEIIKHVFAYCYGCDFQCDDIHVVLEIFKIADKYMFNDLKNVCMTFILNIMKPESFKVIYEFTVEYEYTDLRNSCLSFLEEDRNITTATAVLKWFTLNSPKDLQMPVFDVHKLIFDTWRNPKSEEPFYQLSTILRNQCYNNLKEYAGQLPGGVIKYIPGPLRTSLADLRDPSYAPLLKISLRNDNAEEVVKALHERFSRYGPEDIGIHITNEDIPSIVSKLSKLPCYNCASEGEYDIGRVTLYFSDLTKENLHYIHDVLRRLDPDCDQRYTNDCKDVEHRFVHSYMFPRCTLKKENFSDFGEQIINWDEWFLLPECLFWVYSSCIETQDEKELHDLAIRSMRRKSLEMWEFLPSIKLTSSNNDIPGW